MILERLTIENFGLFAGSQTIELRPRGDSVQARPVVLIGGKNGCGKSTLMQAVRLCLYGPRSIGGRVTAQEYDEHRLSLVHRAASGATPVWRSGVALDFEHAHLGVRHLYHVGRLWESTSGQVRETLEVLKDGEPCSDLDPEHWQEFLNDLLPLGVSQFFFFDGERIQALAECDTDTAFLAGSVKTLLGIDLIERLQSDLAIHVNRTITKSAPQEHAIHLDTAQERIRALDDQVTQARQERAHTQNALNRLAGQIQDQEAKLVSEGGGLCRTARATPELTG